MDWKHGTFTKNGKRHFTAKLYLRFYDHNNVRRNIPLFEDKTSAEDAARAIKRLVNVRASGGDIPLELHRFIENTLPSIRAYLVEYKIIDASRVASARPLDDHITEWERHLRSKSTSDREYVKLKIGRVRRLFKACKFHTWNDIAGVVVANQLAKWRNDPDEQMAVQTSNHYLQAAKQFGVWMRDDAKCVSTTPLSRENPINVKRNLRHDRRSYSVTEFRFLLGHLRTAGDRYFITAAERSVLYRFAAGTGLRFGAIGQIEVRDFGQYKGSPAVLIRAGASNKYKEDRWVMFSVSLWRAVRLHIAGKPLREKAFTTPKNRHASKIVKWDLDAARKRWIDEAANPQERLVRQQSDFLRYKDSDGRFLDFHAFRHTRGVWLVEHNKALPHQVMEALGVHSLSLVERYTHSGEYVNAALIEKEPDLTPTSLPPLDESASKTA